MSLNLLVITDREDYPDDSKIGEAALAFREYPAGNYSIHCECSKFPLIWRERQWLCKLYLGFMTPAPSPAFPVDSLLLVVAGEPRDEGNKNSVVGALAKVVGGTNIEARQPFIGTQRDGNYHQGFVIRGVAPAKLLEFKARLKQDSSSLSSIQ